jgi:hypothetical protein
MRWGRRVCMGVGWGMISVLGVGMSKIMGKDKRVMGTTVG